MDVLDKLFFYFKLEAGGGGRDFILRPQKKTFFCGFPIVNEDCNNLTLWLCLCLCSNIEGSLIVRDDSRALGI